MGLWLRDSTIGGTASGRKPALLHRLAGFCLAGVLLLLPLDLHGQDKTPSGTISIHQVQVAFIGSGNLGGGTLTFEGKQYRFTIGGLGVGGFGYSEMRAVGEVYDLKRVEDFAGAYAQGRYGAVAGTRDTGEMWLQNSAGVSLHLKTEREGLALSLGADAVYIEFDK